MTNLISASNNTLGFDIYKALSWGRHGNLAISPASISTALTMTWTGARNATAAEMAKVLHLDVLPEVVASKYAELISRLVSRAQSNNIELAIANRIFNDDRVRIEDKFLETLLQGYGVATESVDFVNNAESARNVINSWVEQATKERIKNLLTSGSVDSSTKMVLVNALYLLAPWAKAFDERKTYKAKFRSGGESLLCNMMEIKDQFRYAKTNNADVVEIPYAGNNMSMVLVVPSSDDGLVALENGMSADKLSAMRSQLRQQKVTVRMPRFTIDPSDPIALGEVLYDLGMETAFSSEADFTGMTSGRTGISNVYHKTFVKVAESGTEMAAATAVAMTRGMSMDPFVTADHPFFWAIIDHADDFILGMGRVTKPVE